MRAVFSNAQGDALVGQAHAAARRASIDLPVSSMSMAATGRFFSAAAPPDRRDAEHHFGEREARCRIVERDDGAAGERELQAAAHAETVDHRGGREGQVVELLQHVPARAHKSERLIGRGKARELLDVGPGDE